jgi:hypothetical protein
MSATPSARLIRIRSKIERAKKHIHDLETCIDDLRRNDLYKITTESDPRTGEKVYGICLQAAPAEVSLIIGDAVHNLRSSLDHLVWQLVLAAGNSPDEQTMFPIQKSASTYKSKSPRKIQGVDSVAKSLINSLNPYQGGNDDLWAIHELDITDKHRLLLVASTAMSGIFHDRIVPNWIADATRWSPGIRFPVLKDGAEIRRVPVGSPNQDVDLNLTTEIAFGETKVVEGKPVLPFLHQLTHLVDGIVNQFARFL